jgi:hypothetical protein
VTLAANRVTVTPYPPDWPHRAPWKLNRELLLPETERIVFVVDVPRGAAPKREALDHLVSLAGEYGQRDASWVLLGEPGAPNIRWAVPDGVRVKGHNLQGGSVDEAPLTADTRDSLRYSAEVPSCPDGALSANTSYVFVRYLGRRGSSYGAARVVTADRSCGKRDFPLIYLAQDRIARDRAPGITRAFLEGRALAHEYGHVLGLASNPAHGRWVRTGPYSGQKHCVHRECAVAIPTAKALLKGQMRDYCTACQRDIQQAREQWLTGKVFPEVRRLPQIDPADQVERLKAHNFRSGGEADKLLRFGKLVVPALIARLPELPAKRNSSPRHYATRLVLKILVAEDVKRRGISADDVQHLSPSGELAEALLAWWEDEAERFMSGDAWELPDVLQVRQRPYELERE